MSRSRAALALVAVVVLGWLGVMERDARLHARGVRAGGHLRTAADVDRAERALLGARLLNPDSAPDVDRAVLYMGAGQPRRAIALVEDVLRREPENLEAWGLLFGFTRGGDPARARRALSARRRLDPLNARRNR